MGTPIADAELARVDAPGKARVFGTSNTTVLVFFRAAQPRSREALREIAGCMKDLQSRPLRWVGLVADREPPQAVRALLAETGFAIPTLVDAGDALYGSLGLSLHPVVVVADAQHRLAAFEPFRAVDFCRVLTAQVRRVLGEISEDELRAALAPPPAEAADLKRGAKERMREMLEGRK